MAQNVSLSERDYAPGSYSVEVDAPSRKNGATVTLTRPGAGWPVGEVFEWRVYEKERNGVLTPLASAVEFGGQIIGKGGVINPPLQVTLTWPLDRDKDRIRFEIDVRQTIRTAITLAFV